MNVTPTREGPRINEEIGVMRVRAVVFEGGVRGFHAFSPGASPRIDMVDIVG